MNFAGHRDIYSAWKDKNAYKFYTGNLTDGDILGWGCEGELVNLLRE
jgi:hypothetical protein